MRFVTDKQNYEQILSLKDNKWKSAHMYTYIKNIKIKVTMAGKERNNNTVTMTYMNEWEEMKNTINTRNEKGRTITPRSMNPYDGRQKVLPQSNAGSIMHFLLL